MRVFCLVLLVISLIISTSVIYAQRIDPSLVLYLPFDEEDGEEAADFSQYGLNGRLIGNAQFAEGKFGNALELNGSNYVEVGVNEKLDIENDITIMAWAKGSDFAGDWRTIVGKGPTQVLGQNTFSYDLRVNQNGPAVFSLNIGGWKQITTLIKEDTWYHMAGTYDGSKMALYLDGELINTIQVDGKILQTVEPVQVGALNKNDYWVGTVDELRIWDRTLNADQIKTNMMQGKDDFKAVYPQEKLTITWCSVKTEH